MPKNGQVPFGRLGTCRRRKRGPGSQPPPAVSIRHAARGRRQCCQDRPGPRGSMNVGNAKRRLTTDLDDTLEQAGVTLAYEGKSIRRTVEIGRASCRERV